MRRSALDRPRLLDNAGERLISDVYERRSRKQTSWGDCAEIVILTLEATGALRHFTQAGLDPLTRIQVFNGDRGHG